MPFVSHDEGTQLVIEHIEKYWAPTVSSDDLVRAFFERWTDVGQPMNRRIFLLSGAAFAAGAAPSDRIGMGVIGSADGARSS